MSFACVKRQANNTYKCRYDNTTLVCIEHPNELLTCGMNKFGVGGFPLPTPNPPIINLSFLQVPNKTHIFVNRGLNCEDWFKIQACKMK